MSRTGKRSLSSWLYLRERPFSQHFEMRPVFRLSDNADMNGEDTSSSSSEEEKDGARPGNDQSLKPSWMSLPQSQAPASADRRVEEEEEEDNDGGEGSCLPTIFFLHTVEPKKVRLIFGERKIIF